MMQRVEVFVIASLLATLAQLCINIHNTKAKEVFQCSEYAHPTVKWEQDRIFRNPKQAQKGKPVNTSLKINVEKYPASQQEAKLNKCVSLFVYSSLESDTVCKIGFVESSVNGRIQSCLSEVFLYSV